MPGSDREDFLVVQGTIASLRTRQGFGFITSEGRRSPVFFRREAVDGDRSINCAKASASSLSRALIRSILGARAPIVSS